MRRFASSFFMLVAALCTAASITACGGAGGGLPGAIAVGVSGQTVTKAAVAHWTSLNAIVSLHQNPSQPLSKRETLAPPQYAACIKYLQGTTPNTTNSATTLTTSELKAECQRKYEEIRRNTLEALITDAWLTAEAAAQHIEVTAEEINERFTEFKRSRYATEAEYQRFLKNTGETLSDVRYLQRVALLMTKLGEKAALEHGSTAAASLTQAQLQKRWTPKTDCSAGYVVPSCRQYSG